MCSRDLDRFSKMFDIQMYRNDFLQNLFEIYHMIDEINKSLVYPITSSIHKK
jgi:hypothetical protein